MKKILLFVAILATLGYTFRNTEFVRSIIDINSLLSNGKKNLFGSSDNFAVKEVEVGHFHEIDEKALGTSLEHEKSIKSLAAYFSSISKNEREKVRVAFRWIADRLQYDAKGFQDMKNVAPQNPQNVFKTRKAVCQGYSELFVEILKEMGIKAEVITGISKAFTFVETGILSKIPDHAWVVAQVDNKWELYDVTWSGKGIKYDEDGKLVPADDKFEEFWFNGDPKKFIYTHFPQNPKWQLLDTPITFKQYEKMPYVNAPFFELGLPMDDEALKEPLLYYTPPCPVKISVAPLGRKLRVGKKYTFRLESPYVTRVSIVNNELKKWTYIKRDKEVFQMDYEPKEGTILLCVEYKNKFSTLLSYEAE